MVTVGDYIIELGGLCALFLIVGFIIVWLESRDDED